MSKIDDKNAKIDRRYSIGFNVPTRRALKHMNEFGVNSLVLTEAQHDGLYLKGIVSDGDIRRALIANKLELEDPIYNIATKSPKAVSVHNVDLVMKNSFMLDKFNILPVVDNNNKLLNIIIAEHLQNYDEENKFKTAVVMVGGKGTRLRPLTLNTPKPLVKFLNKTMISVGLGKLAALGYEKVILSTNHMWEQIVSEIGDGQKFGLEVEYLLEQSPMGTAGSLSLMSEQLLDASMDTILVTNTDIISDISIVDMEKFHSERGNKLTVCGTLWSFEVPYGVVNAENGFVQSLAEKPRVEKLINSGLYMIDKSIIKSMTKSQPIHMTGLIDQLLQTETKVGLYQHEGYWFDVGTPDQLKEAEDYIQNLIGDQ